MQFYLNGFRPGDPAVRNQETAQRAEAANNALPENVDVLIVGCGPAGLTLAAQLSAFPELSICIIDAKQGRLELGQADGIACRTMEMFESFNFSYRVLKEGYFVNEVSFWKPNDSQREHIQRHDRIQDVEDGLSEFPHVILNQARIHDFYLDIMERAPRKLRPHYSRKLIDLRIDQDTANTHPVIAQIQRSDRTDNEPLEIINARYAVGCDGARSSVRKTIGQSLLGDSANQAWGVMDILAVTDFPDIRLKVAIQSANNGNMIIIPREGGYLVRLYVEMDKLGEDERASDRQIDIAHIIETAQQILNPYTLEVKQVVWWSVYEIGQRICKHYDNLKHVGGDQQSPRVFIAGDACHTHSPKAGQGMNFSMQDSFNLGWKLAAVLRKQSHTKLLNSYSEERQPAAQELIDFDREWASMFNERPAEDASTNATGVSPRALKEYFSLHGRFTAGVATRYTQSLITGDTAYQFLAQGFDVGKRFHSAPVIRFADARPVQLGHAGKADGRWRLYAFADKAQPDAPTSRLRQLCDFLENTEDSPIRRYTSAQSDLDAVFDVRAIFQQRHTEISIDAIPPILLPKKGQFGLVDYEKIFCSDEKNGDIYDTRSIDRSSGCVVVVRPDQYVALVIPLDAYGALTAFFSAFMLTVDNRRGQFTATPS